MRNIMKNYSGKRTLLAYKIKRITKITLALRYLFLIVIKFLMLYQAISL